MPEKFQFKVEESTMSVSDLDQNLAAKADKVDVLVGDLKKAKEKIIDQAKLPDTKEKAVQEAIEGVKISKDVANSIIKIQTEGDPVYIQTSPAEFSKAWSEIQGDLEAYDAEISKAWQEAHKETEQVVATTKTSLDNLSTAVVAGNNDANKLTPTKETVDDKAVAPVNTVNTGKAVDAPVTTDKKETTPETPDPIMDVLANLKSELMVKDGKIVLSDKGLAAIKEIGHLVNPSATPGLTAEAILVKELQQKKEKLLNGDKIEISSSDKRLGAKERKLRRVDREIGKIDEQIKKLQNQETKFDKKQVAANSSQAEKQNYNLYLNSINNYIKTKLLTKAEYSGKTYMFDSYVPLFANVCLKVNSPEFNGIVFVPGENGGKEIPIYVQRTFDKNTDNTDLYGDEKEAPHKNGVVCGSTILETYFRDHTNMSAEQAKKNANLITLAGIGTGLYFGIKWLFEKPKKDGDMGFFGKAATIAGVLLGSNIAAEGLTGKSLTEIINGVWTGKLTWSDFADGKIFGKEKVADPGLTRVVILKNIPTNILLATGSIEKGDNDAAKINYDNLEKLLQAKLDKDPTNTNVKKQLEIVQDLKKSETGKADIEKTIAGLGLTYTSLSAMDKDVTLDKTIDAVVARQKELRQLAVKNNTDYNYDDPAVHAYIYEGKGDKNALPTKTNVATTTAPDAKKTTETPAAEKLDPALDAIDKNEAAKLQEGLNAMLKDITFKNVADKPKFENLNGVIYVSSYGFKTPVRKSNDGNYEVSTLPVNFPGAEQALRTANLVNFLVVTNKQVYNKGDFELVQDKKTYVGPFHKGTREGVITVGKSNEDLTGWNWVNDYYTKAKNTLDKTVTSGRDLRPWTNDQTTLEKIGGKQLGSEAGINNLLTYLNGLKDTGGVPIWYSDSHPDAIANFVDEGSMKFKAKEAAAPTPKENGDTPPAKKEEEDKNIVEKKTAKKKTAGKKTTSSNKVEGKKEVVKKDPAVLAESWSKNADFQKQTGIADKAFYVAWAEAYVAGKQEFSYNNKTYERQAGKNAAPKEKGATKAPETNPTTTPETPKKKFDVTKLIDTRPYVEKIQELAKSFNFQDPLAKKAIANGGKLEITQGMKKIILNVAIKDGAVTTWHPLGEIPLADVMSGADVDAQVLQNKVENFVSRYQVEQTLKNDVFGKPTFGDYKRNYPLNSFASKFPDASLKDPVSMTWDGEVKKINWKDKIGDSMFTVTIKGYNVHDLGGIDEDGAKKLVLRVDDVFTNGNFDAGKLNKTLEVILHKNLKAVDFE